MKYNNLKPKSGKNPGGICSILIADIDWIQNKIKRDFSTGKILTPIQFYPGRDFIQVNFLEKTYNYTETPKETKSGSYFEILVAGTLDYMDAALQQQLESLRYKQVISVVQFMPGGEKIIGNKDFGLNLRFSHKNATDNNGGLLSIPVEISGNTVDSPPFYEI